MAINLPAYVGVLTVLALTNITLNASVKSNDLHQTQNETCTTDEQCHNITQKCNSFCYTEGEYSRDLGKCVVMVNEKEVKYPECD